VIIVGLHTVDPHSSVDTSNHVYFAEIPVPGDIVITAKGQRVDNALTASWRATPKCSAGGSR
jgi:hypothetical protein